ncbi:MFS transporter [Paraburkholderia sp. Ac-20336]|uniref:MFS transporter n=1 Tax=unclassified Paraburkholderia TaxID=2615204 RepID=UPI001420CB1C|nr:MULTISPECIES: MFS transporter [unclassified Paraburkholderia]MBN3804906.1 MFS transporter [Paraburkholderia sp. Ac-20336]MBN3846345.1 MFS transporter [Paraburkholderia sp. Ac-20342]NIF76882.1 MFS transporter [Paraburkholderia sp. Cy-641]
MFTQRTGGYAATDAVRVTRTRFTILAVILLLATVAYADRAILSIAGPGIAKEFGLDHVQLGYVLSAFSWAYVVGQIPGGLLLDRLGTKTMYGATLVLWSIATILVGLIGHVTTDLSVALGLLFALRFALGLIEAPSFPANSRVAVMWFPKEERGLATSLFASASYFAVAIFSPLAGWLTAKFGWPAPFFALGLIGIASAGVWAVVMHEPGKHPRVSQAELDRLVAGGAMIDIDSAHERLSRPVMSGKALRLLLGNRMLWCSYIGQYCVIALSYFFITWFPIYLVQARGMNVMQAGLATMLPAVSGFLGGIAGGVISDWLIRKGWSVSWARKTPYIVGMAVGCCIVFSAFTESNTAIVLLMTLAFFGKGAAAGAGTWAIVSDTAPREAVGLAGAIFNCVGNIGGIVTPIVFGYIVQATGGYTAGLYFVAAHCLIAAVVYLVFMGRIERVKVN